MGCVVALLACLRFPGAICAEQVVPVVSWALDGSDSCVPGMTVAEFVKDARRGCTVAKLIPGEPVALPGEVVDRLGQALTVCAWIKPLDGTPEWQRLLAVDYAHGWRDDVMVTRRWGRFIVRDARTTTDSIRDPETKRMPRLGFWNHLTMTVDKDNVTVALDGDRYFSVRLAESRTAPIRAVGVFHAWNGMLSSINVYDRVLSTNEIAAVIAREAPPDDPDAAALAPNIPDMTLDEVTFRTGYMVKEIKAFFPPIEQWGALGIEPKPETIADTYARERFGEPPAPYVHPRVYFGPGDLPRLRKHLKESRLARTQMELMRGRCLQISPNEKDWLDVPYSPSDFNAVYTNYLAKGMRINRRMGYHGPWVGGWINELAEGKDPEYLAGKWHLNTPQAHGRQHMMHLLPYEALRCLVDEDEAGGKRLSAALVTICDRFAQHMDQYGPRETNWQRVYQNLSSSAIGLTYDWVYPYMTDAQRKRVRAFIGDITRGKTFIGLDQVPAFPGNTTNWIIIHMNLLPLILSIEGEEGYDEMVYTRCVEGMRKWVYVSCGPKGAPFEGFNKSTYAPQWLVPLAKQGVDFIGTEYSKNVYRRYGLHTMLPYGRQHVFETGIGKMRDVRPMKYAHPDDPVIDLIHGAAVEPLLRSDHVPVWKNIRTTYAPDWSHVFVCDDPTGLRGHPFNYEELFDDVMAYLTDRKEPLSYYSDYRGVMTARTGWDRNATFLYFEPRNVPGGHTWDSRNDFVLASHGRLWGNRPEATEGSSDRRSVILVDGKGMGHQCPPGRTVALVDNEHATFCVGDAKWAYSYRADAGGARIEDVTPNDSRLKPSPLPWMDQPWGMLPAWNTGKIGGDRHGHWSPHNPVQRAYRTIGLVRGRHPYVLVVDDYRKDDQAHWYEWLMQVPDDVALLRAGRYGDRMVDLLLGEPEYRRQLLLVRVLEAGDGTGFPDCLAGGAKVEEYSVKVRGRSVSSQRVVLPVHAVEGRYRVLLYPHREGDPLPETVLREGELSIAVDGQEDVVSFVPGDDGRTRVRVKRLGKVIADLR